MQPTPFRQSHIGVGLGGQVFGAQHRHGEVGGALQQMLLGFFSVPY